MIGSEGTLGVITATVLKLFPLPSAQAATLVVVASPDDALALLALAQRHAGPALATCELLSDICLGLVLRNVPDARQPVGPSPWYVLLEVSDSDGCDTASALLESLLEQALEAGIAADTPPCSILTRPWHAPPAQTIRRQQSKIIRPPA